jgi:competence protein ComEC
MAAPIQQQTTAEEHDAAMKVNSRRLFISFWVALILLATIIAFLVLAFQTAQEKWFGPSIAPAADRSTDSAGTGEMLRITMLNIGQGDAILIQTPSKKDILIDAGSDRAVLSELGEALPPWNRTIEYVIATHDDADHIGGMIHLKQYYTVEQWYVGSIRKETAQSTVFRQFLTTQASVHSPQRGDVITFDTDVTFEVLSPDAQHAYEEINDSSIAGILRYKKFSMLLTADVGIEEEQRWLTACLIRFACAAFDVDVMKVGHHGSRTSTSAALLEATTPHTALISMGEANSYGHPHSEVLQRLQKHQAAVFRTDLHGTVRCYTNGSDALNCETETK